MRRLLATTVATLFLFTSSALAMEHPSYPWCGWFMRIYVAATDPGTPFNRALEWLHWGHRCETPHEGCVVVWSRGHGNGHVGVIVGKGHRPGYWLVKSGNDGHAVRTRERYVGNAMGFREGALKPSYHASYRLASADDASANKLAMEAGLGDIESARETRHARRANRDDISRVVYHETCSIRGGDGWIRLGYRHCSRVVEQTKQVRHASASSTAHKLARVKHPKGVQETRQAWAELQRIGGAGRTAQEQAN